MEAVSEARQRSAVEMMPCAPHLSRCWPPTIAARASVDACSDSDCGVLEATTSLWLVRVSEREVNPHAVDLQLRAHA